MTEAWKSSENKQELVKQLLQWECRFEYVMVILNF